MKQKKFGIAVSITALLLCLAIQVADIVRSETKYTWKSAIIDAILIAVVVLIVFLVRNKQRKKCKKLNLAWQNAEYENVLKIGQSMPLNYFDTRVKDNIQVCMAASYLEIGNEEKFLTIINEITTEDNIPHKLYWLAIFYLNKNDVVNAAKMEEALRSEKDSKPKEDCLKILRLVKLRKEDYEFDENDIEVVKNIHSTIVKKMLRI